MQAGELFGDVLETEYAWLGSRGASPSVKLFNGTPVAWNPLSGVDREVEQIWRQPTPPPAGTHYAWEGGPHASASVRYDTDGNETARNLIRNPAPYGSPGQKPMYWTATRSSFTWTDAHGGSAIYADDESARKGYATIGRHPAEIGWHMHGEAWFYNDTDETGTADLVVYDYGGTPVTSSTHITLDPGESGRLVNDLITINGDGQTNMHVWTPPGWHVNKAMLVPDNVVPYFDGSTPSDRANDLWYDAEGVPHEWENGEGWVEADSRFAPVPDGFMHLPVDTSFTGDTPDVYRTHDDSVRQYTSRILVNGVEREADDWNVEGDVTGDLPQQVTAVNGVMQSTGKIEWASPEDVDDGVRNPWNPSTGWVPERGDRVEIYVSDGETEWRQFTGVIDKTTGRTNGGFRSTIVDDIDKTSVEVSHEPLLSIMPSIAFDGSEGWRYIGLHPLYFVDYALRQAGFYATPPQENIASLYVPLQGSVWPHRGRLRSQTNSTHGFNTVTPWGLGRRNFTATYDSINDYPMSEPTQLTIMVAPDHAGATDFFVDYGSRAHHLRLLITSSRQARAYKNSVEIARLDLGDATVVNMMAKNGRISLRTNLGDEDSGTFSTSGSGMSAIVVNAGEDASVAGLQVSHPRTTGQEHRPTRWEPTAVYDTTSLRLSGIINASPNIEGRKALNLITEINDAILAAMWIDEHGVMQWVQSDTLRRRDPVRTVTTLDDILSFDWETVLLQSSSRVTVKGKQPSITRGRWRYTELARGRGEIMKSGDEIEIFLEPEAGVDWIMPSYHFLEMGGTVEPWGGWGSYNNPAYSAAGLHFTDDGGETEIFGLPCEITTEPLGNQKVLIQYRAGSWPSDVEGVLKTSEDHQLWPRNRGENLPRLVGMGKIEWMDDEVTVEGPGGPGPELVHDSSYWANRVESEGSKENIAEFLASQTTVPQPVVRGLEIIPDPRLQLGDVITIESNNYLGVRLTALVVGIRRGADQDGFAQSLTVRIIGSESTFTSYEQFQEQMDEANLTYQQWQTIAPTTQSYEDFNAES